MSNEWTPPGTGRQNSEYLVPAIISAVCCFPLGVVSSIFAAQGEQQSFCRRTFREH
jgi:hypothetical protein